jgi:hypothetical protein
MEYEQLKISVLQLIEECAEMYPDQLLKLMSEVNRVVLNKYGNE